MPIKLDPDRMEDLTVNSIAKLVQAAQTPNAPIGGKPYLILNEDQKVEDVEKFLPAPTSKRGSPSFGRSESFIRYVNEHKDDGSRIYIQSPTMITAVLDHHDEGPRWGLHQAIYRMQFSLEWKTWTAKNKAPMTQKEFCEFIEDNSRDILSRTDMVELVRTLQVNSSVDYKSYERGDSGNTALQFTKTTKAQAGERGEVELPPTFTLSIPAFEGGGVLPIGAKLRFDLAESKLKLWYELQQVERILNDHTQAVVDLIAKETGIAPFFGTP